MTDTQTETVEAPFLTHGPGWYTRVGKASGNRYLFLVNTGMQRPGQVSMGRAGFFWLPRADAERPYPTIESSFDLGPGWIGHVNGLIRMHQREREHARWNRRGRKADRAIQFAERRGRAS